MNESNSLLEIDSLIQSFSNPVSISKLSPRKSTYNYSIGDVVKINPLRKINTVVRLARIRAINIQDDSLLKLLDNDPDFNHNNDEKKQNIEHNIHYIGVEYFNWKANNNTDLIKDGTINGIKIFDVKKPGYGAFIKHTNIISTLWTKTKSKKALKLQKFDYQTFIKAAKFGSMPVIKHMLQMTDYPNDPSIIKVQDKTKGALSAICQAISCNHYNIVQLLLQKHANYKQNTQNISIVESKNDIKYDYKDEYILPKLRTFKPRKNTDVYQSKDKKTKFYSPSIFDKLCKYGNIKMLKLLLEYDAWPVYYKHSHGLYLATTGGNLELVKLLLMYLNDPAYVNLPLYFDTKQRTIIPQTNLNLLNVAIGHHRLEIVRYLITEWKYKDIIIKNKCIYHPTLPHILPTLLYTILDCHLHFEHRINFTCDCIELLTKYCDPIDVGLNWVCNKPLCDQQNIIIGDMSRNPCLNEPVLYINRTLCVGSLLSALVYKCQALWVAFRSYDDEKEELRIGIERLITILVQNGIDWNIGKYGLGVKNIISKYTTYPHYKITDLDVNICDDQDFVKFFRNIVSKSVDVFRKIWLNAFVNFYKENKLMVNIFKWYVLDFVVPRNNILDEVKYFTIKPIEKQENEKKDNENNDDNDYIDWEADDS